MRKLERRLEILKLLHGKEMKTSEIAEYFEFDDDRTIRTDLQALRTGMTVLGTKIQIEEQRRGHANLSYKSTIHPIFLALNLSELFALLKLLEEASEGLHHEVYGRLLDCIRSQITPYAEKRLAGKLKPGHRMVVIRNLPEEEAFQKSNDYKLIFWEKSGNEIPIEIVNDNGKNEIIKARLARTRGNTLELKLSDGTTRTINYNNVIIDWTMVDYK
ncbi:MAG: hypothetical protein LBJ14_00510 [Desulfarculales bacterium]|jgi:hypothetical protein|nr:hypothetical protein [Desulfarculales bacterium]